MDEIAEVLESLQKGERRSPEELLPLVYSELRRLAASMLSRERPGQTLQATALVHEAWMRMAGSGVQQQGWNGQRHFFAAAAEVMRRVLIDRARSKGSERHGGKWRSTELDAVEIAAPLPDDQLLALHEALGELDREDPQVAELVKLRFFVGLTQAQAAEVLGLSSGGASRSWAFARVWLFDRIQMQ